MSRADELDRPLMALDIETMPTVSDPEFDEPSHWRVLGIGLGTVSASTDCQTTVLLRRSDTEWAEYLLIARAIEWLQVRHGWPICTYNGTTFDLPILRHRARETLPSHITFDVSVPARLDSVLDTSTHRDLFREVRDRRPEHSRWPSLEEACHEYEISGSSTRYNQEVVTGADVPRLGAKLLGVAMDGTEEERTLRDYTREDVRLVLALADALDTSEE